MEAVERRFYEMSPAIVHKGLGIRGHLLMIDENSFTMRPQRLAFVDKSMLEAFRSLDLSIEFKYCYVTIHQRNIMKLVIHNCVLHCIVK